MKNRRFLLSKLIFQILFFMAFTLTNSSFSITTHNELNNLSIENLFFTEYIDQSHFAFHKNQYIEIFPGIIKVWGWNTSRKTYNKPLIIAFQDHVCHTVLGYESDNFKYNLVRGEQNAHRITNQNLYRKICMPRIYPGIDAEIYFSEGGLEFDFIIEKTSSSDLIKIKIENYNETQISENSLYIQIDENSYFTLNIPHVYLTCDKEQLTKLSANFTKLLSNTYGIQLSKIPEESGLIIDPLLTYSTYLNINQSGIQYTEADEFTSISVNTIQTDNDITTIAGTIKRPSEQGYNIDSFILTLSIQNIEYINKNQNPQKFLTIIRGSRNDIIKTVYNFFSDANYIIAGGTSNSPEITGTTDGSYKSFLILIDTLDFGSPTLHSIKTFSSINEIFIYREGSEIRTICVGSTLCPDVSYTELIEGQSIYNCTGSGGGLFEITLLSNSKKMATISKDVIDSDLNVPNENTLTKSINGIQELWYAYKKVIGTSNGNLLYALGNSFELSSKSGYGFIAVYIRGEDGRFVKQSEKIFAGNNSLDLVFITDAVLLDDNKVCFTGITNSISLPGPILSQIPETNSQYHSFVAIYEYSDNNLIPLGTYYIFGNNDIYINSLEKREYINSLLEKKVRIFLSGYTTSTFSQVSWNSSILYPPISSELNQGNNTQNYDALFLVGDWDPNTKTIHPVWKSLFGGRNDDLPLGLSVINRSQFCFVGITNSPDLPLQNSAYSMNFVGNYEYFISSINFEGKIIYVNPNSTISPFDGSSWQRGFKSIQQAIDSASPYDEIWVKKGDYKEYLSISNLTGNLYIYGGFTGTETSLSQRDPWNNPVRIYGNTQANLPLLNINDSYYLFIDGIIFENGLSSTDGGALSIKSTNYTRPSVAYIRNCQFYNNQSLGNGGAIYSNNSYVRLINCIFTNNTSFGNGTAICMDNNSYLKIIHCTFARNLNPSNPSNSHTISIINNNLYLVVLNSIIWNIESLSNVPQIANLQNLSEYNLNSSIIQGITCTTDNCEYVSNANPQFHQEPTNSDLGNLTLQQSSPAINNGNPIVQGIEFGSVYTDVTGKKRITWGACKPDAGAFESDYSINLVLNPNLPEETIQTINSTITLPDYEAKDSCGNDLTNNVMVNILDCSGQVVASNVKSFKPNQISLYTIQYLINIPYLNSSQTLLERRIKVIPDIHLIGSKDIIINCGEIFVDPDIVVNAGIDMYSTNKRWDKGLDTRTPGRYVLTYEVTVNKCNSVFENTIQRNVTVIDNEPPKITLIGDKVIYLTISGPNLNFYWEDPGVIVYDSCDGYINKDNITSTSNTQQNRTTITYSVKDRAGNQTSEERTIYFIINQQENCVSRCENTPFTEDKDKDGLNVCIESCLGTSDNDVDTDRDGIPDVYEYRYGLQPTIADSHLDKDLDGLSNIEEYLINSDPSDSNSPWKSVFVSSKDGMDTNPGTREKPFKTINKALQVVQFGGSIQRQSIVLFPGDYYENISLIPNTVLIGITAYGPNDRAIIYGTITGADNSNIISINISSLQKDMSSYLEKQSEKILLNTGNTQMHIKDVKFRGSGNEIGILLSGGRPYNTVIENCEFTNLKIAIKILDSIPIIRKCVFKLSQKTKSNADSVGIYVVNNSGSTNPSHSLGSVDDPNTGWNTFQIEEGKAVVNERQTNITAHNNDWGTDNLTEIQNLVSGPVDTSYNLPKGKALISSSLACVIKEAQKDTPITNATVEINPNKYPPQTKNTNGVYLFPALEPGNYQITASAPTYISQSRSTTLRETEEKVETIFLARENPSNNVEGENPQEGEINNNNNNRGSGGCGCGGKKSERIPFTAGEVLFVCCIISLLGMQNKSRKK